MDKLERAAMLWKEKKDIEATLKFIGNQDPAYVGVMVYRVTNDCHESKEIESKGYVPHLIRSLKSRLEEIERISNTF